MKKEYSGGGEYIVFTTDKGKTILLHRLIMNFPEGLQIDHINRKPLDNRRENLRLATKQFNAMNRTEMISNTSGFRGVSFSKLRKKWESYITYNRKKINLGRFINFEDAVSAKKRSRIKVFWWIFAS